MMGLIRIVAALVALAFVALTTGATANAAESRLALVIGVTEYARLPRLPNAVRDATLLKDKFKDLGFDVTFISDVTRQTLHREIRDFGRKLEAAGPESVALLYFAGHGVQDKSQKNFLLAADVDVRSETDLPLEGLPLDSVLGTFEHARARMSIVILDACRDYPFATSAHRGATRGLAPPDVARGLLIAYATEPGKAAQDGPPGGNGPFAQALADELSGDNLNVSAVFERVSRQVLQATGETQFPWVTSRLTEPFSFDVKRADPGAPQPTPAPAPPARPLTINAADLGEIEYGKTVVINSAEAYEDWLRSFPNHARKPTILALLMRLREEQLWKRVEEAPNDAEKKRAAGILLQAFPTGIYAAKAEALKASLEASRPSPFPNPTPEGQDRQYADPSFDCRKAVSPVERLICSNAELARKDRRLAAAFASVISGSPAVAQAQRERSRVWLSQRDACASSGDAATIFACVVRAYDQRIAELHEKRGALASAPSFDCRRAKTRIEQMICADGALSAADLRMAALYERKAREIGADRLQQPQAAWLARRNACDVPSDRETILCLMRAYKRRINELSLL